LIPVLIVDDELLMRIGLKWMIEWEKLGFRIVGEASNGQEALELAELYKPALIITDIMMPIMDGLTLIRKAAELLPDCQFVIMSVFDEFQYAQEALRLGASDYLIKGDIKPEQLEQVLEGVKRSLDKLSLAQGKTVLAGDIKESISYLKENLFKDLLSGFCESEEVLDRRQALHIDLKEGPMALIKLRINRFEEARLKYVEQDERLLRYAVVNMLQELVSRQWNKEIMIESSSEYLIMLNIPDQRELPHRELNHLLDSVIEAMRDFLAISVAVGVSAPAAGFNGLKRALKEAEAALTQLFFQRETSKFFYEETLDNPQEGEEIYLSREEAESFRRLVLTDGAGADAFLEDLRARFKTETGSERQIRQIYMRLLALVFSAFPNTTDETEGANKQTPYERMLMDDSLDDLHELILTVLKRQRDINRQRVGLPQSYARKACDLVMERYADKSISLQTVADAININASYLSRVFKQEIGVTFVSFLTRMRMDQAKHYLRNTSLKVYEVADQVGYPNTTYFSKLFKKMTGLSPEEYRGSSG
jgi:two-component system response regulator YesN